MQARCLAVFLVAAWSSAALAQVTYPALTGRVVDAAGVLPADAEAALDRKLAEHEGATSNQIVVATVSSLEGRDVESYANDLFRAWRLGQAEWDNGVLLLVAPNEREVRIEVGYGLEGVLTDALASDIIRNRILPRFRQGDLPAGVEAGVDAILAAVQGSYEATPERRPAVQDLLPLLPFALWLIFILFLRRRRRRRYGPWGYPVVYGGHGWGGSRRGGFGGGGFSGGGGSSGGGGASGRW